MNYPWLQDSWNQLLNAKQQNRLSHAILISGIEGVGKLDFANSFSRLLLCQQSKSNETSCGSCHACRMHDGKSHPNMLWVEPEKEGQAIKVEQIRQINEFTTQSSFSGEFRVVIIHPADRMNLSASNALLKTLEEPPPGAILILVSDRAASLPATIASRCQRVNVLPPSNAVALDWLRAQLPSTNTDPQLLLNLSSGAPLAARDLASEDKLASREQFYQMLCQLAMQQSYPVQCANQVSDIDLLVMIDFFMSWLTDMLHLQLDSSALQVMNIDFQNSLLQLKDKCSPQANSKLLTYLMNIRRQCCHGFNFNKQLLLEDLFLRWSECTQ